MKKLFLFFTLLSIPTFTFGLETPDVSIGSEHWHTRMSWQPIDGASAYVVKLYGKNGRFIRTEHVRSPNHQKYLYNLKQNTTYIVKVRARNSHELSPWSKRTKFSTKRVRLNKKGLYRYRNQRLGFALQAPRKKLSYGIDYPDKYKFTLRPFEDRFAVAFTSGKKKDSAYFKNRKKGASPERSASEPWTFVVRPAASKKDVKTFVHKKYGVGCKIARYKKTGYRNTQRVFLKRDHRYNGTGNDDCIYPPRAFRVYYSKKHQRVASFTSPHLHLRYNKKVIDTISQKSFHFIPTE